jgi:hypothetical protein
MEDTEVVVGGAEGMGLYVTNKQPFLVWVVAYRWLK